MTYAPAAQPAAAPRPPRSRLLAALTVVAGLLTAVVGFVVFGMAAGFSNCTAGGTGAAALIVGVWMVFAVRGIARRRLATFVGLALAWAWLVGRTVADFPAVAGSFVVVAFLLPAVSVPVVLAWLVTVLLTGAAGLVRMVGAFRRRRAERAAGARTWRVRPVVGLGVRMACLVAATLLVPSCLWATRGRTIEDLARKYAPAAGTARPPVEWGACSVVFLGYELSHADPGPSKPREARLAACADRVADARADLAAIAAAGARYVRMGASGDPLFTDDPDRLAFQEALDDPYMEAARKTGMKTVLVDCQHAQRLGARPDWPEFCRFQRKRIEYYARRYRPDVYLVVCEPMNYHYFTLRPGVPYVASDWTEQLTEMCKLVKAASPATRTGLCLLVTPGNKGEWDVWRSMKALPELDILSVEIYEPEHFALTEERLREFGHPAETGKAFWIAETYNGWALCHDRRWDQDIAWLGVARNFAGAARAETVLVWTFGSFVEGGSFYEYMQGRLHRASPEAGRLSAVGRGFAALAAERP